MKILVFGAGGVGSLLGGMLARMGHDVWLLGRARHMDPIRREGLSVTGIWGDYRIKALETFTAVADIQSKAPDFDLVFLTVKSYDTALVMRDVSMLMGSRAVLVSFQNGLGNIETILKHVAPERYLVSRIITGVEMDQDRVKVTVSADPIAVGALPGVKTQITAPQVAQLLSLAKVPAVAVEDILSVIWAKVIYNCALNAICTLREIPYGEILAADEARNQMRRVVEECYAVGKEEGVVLKPPTAQEFIALLEGRLIPRTASHYPSMLQDLRNGKRLDIDSLNGAIAALGVKHGLSTPENIRLTRDILKKISGTA